MTHDDWYWSMTGEDADILAYADWVEDSGNTGIAALLRRLPAVIADMRQAAARQREADRVWGVHLDIWPDGFWRAYGGDASFDGHDDGDLPEDCDAVSFLHAAINCGQRETGAHHVAGAYFRSALLCHVASHRGDLITMTLEAA